MYIFLSHGNLFKSSIYIYFEGKKVEINVMTSPVWLNTIWYLPKHPGFIKNSLSQFQR